MKNRIKNILKVFALVSFAMSQFFGCKQIEDLKDSEKVAYIVINNSLARSAMPELSIEKMTNFVLKGTFSGEEEQELGAWDNAESLRTVKIPIKPGLWDFKLTAQQGGVSFSATIEKKQIEVALNNLEFNLSVSSLDLKNGKGSINISFTELKNTVASVTAEFFYLDRTSTNLSKEDLKIEATEENPNAVLNKTDVPSGTYLIDFVFYSDAEKTVKLGTYTELVNVTENCTSSAVIKNLDLANLYQITYDLNGGNFSDGFTAPASYSSCSSIELPLAANVIKTGYELDGWYFESSDDIFDGNFQGMTGDKKLYAKWKGGTSNFTVNHYQQNIYEYQWQQEQGDEYALFETEVLSGTTDSMSVATARNYTGFTAKDFEQKKVLADGTTVVDIYYDRKTITITFSPKLTEIDKMEEKYGAAFYLSTLMKKEVIRDKYKYEISYGQFSEDTTIIPLLMTPAWGAWFARTETSKGKWREVYDWAISDERGEEKYEFSKDYKDTEISEKPMVSVHYEDILIWCNAISEKEGLSPVYLIKDSKTPIRKQNLIYSLNKDNKLIVDENANGYRLPTKDEWDYSAYYFSDTTGTAYWHSYPSQFDNFKDDWVIESSAPKDVINNNAESNNGYEYRTPNVRGLFDMLGNVSEHVFIDFYYNTLIGFGGDFDTHKKYCTRSWVTSGSSEGYTYSPEVGFRLVRSFLWYDDTRGWQ